MSSDREQAQNRLNRAIARRDAVKQMSKVGFANLTVAEAGIVGELFQELEQAVDKAEQLVAKYGSAEYCQWKATLNYTHNTIDAYVGYTKDADADGFYHWRVAIYQGTVFGGLAFMREKKIIEERGKFKLKRSAKDKAEREARKYWEKYFSKPARKTRKKAK